MAKKRGNNEGSITRRKDGRWMAQVTIGRDPQSGKLKRATFYGTTRQDAAAKLTTALRELGQGTFVAPHKVTLGAWLETWLWEYKKPTLRPVTFDSYEMVVRRHLKPTLGHLVLRDVRPEHLQRFYNRQSATGLSARTVRYSHTLLYGALTQAEKNGLVVRNVATHAEPPRKTRYEPHTLTLQQVAQAQQALHGERLSAALVLAFGTGLRRGELLALRWQDVDWGTGVVHVRQTLGRVRAHGARPDENKTRLVFQEPKTASSRRTVPLTEGCLAALKHHKARQAEERLLLGPAYQDHGLVFCREDGRPLDLRAVTWTLARVLQQAGLPALRLHDTRHTFATLLLELGESPKTVQTILGHSSIAITLDIYSHVSLELEHRAASRLHAALTGEK